MKKLYLFIVACLITITGFGQSGTTGSLTWSINNGTITISGSGAMPNYDLSALPPWYGNSAIKQAIIGDGVTSIGSNAFLYCNEITSITILNSVTSIGEKAFYGCSTLTSVTIPNSVTNIGWYAFRGCSGLTSLTIPNSVTSIGNGAFWECTGLTSLTISNSVTSIGSSAFYYCKGLTSVTIPNSLTSTGEGTFYYCTGLTSVTIPNSVKSIGDYAFKDCSGLKDIYAEGATPATCNNTTFQGVNKTKCNLHVPANYKPRYSNAEGWKNFTVIVADLVSSLGSFSVNNVTKVYPTPTSGMVYIETTNSKAPAIQVYSLYGRLLFTFQGNAVDLSDFANGIYILHVDGEVVKVVKK